MTHAADIRFGRTFVAAILALAMAAAIPESDAGNEIVLQTGDPSPDGNGVIAAILTNPMINDSGEAVVLTLMTDTDAGDADDLALLRGNAEGWTVIAREGDPAPGTEGKFGDLGPFGLNNAGQVAIGAMLTETAMGPGWDDGALYRGDGGTPVLIARIGQPTPGPGVFHWLYPKMMNQAGEIVFIGLLRGLPGDEEDVHDVCVGSGGPLREVVRHGTDAPDGNGYFAHDAMRGFNPVISESGDVAFFGYFEGTEGGPGLLLRRR